MLNALRGAMFPTLRAHRAEAADSPYRWFRRLSPLDGTHSLLRPHILSLLKILDPMRPRLSFPSMPWFIFLLVFMCSSSAADVSRAPVALRSCRTDHTVQLPARNSHSATDGRALHGQQGAPRIKHHSSLHRLVLHDSSTWIIIVVVISIISITIFSIFITMHRAKPHELLSASSSLPVPWCAPESQPVLKGDSKNSVVMEQMLRLLHSVGMPMEDVDFLHNKDGAHALCEGSDPTTEARGTRAGDFNGVVMLTSLLLICWRCVQARPCNSF